ncbi:MAG: Rossmann-like and DUF2520 domain-containing protein [Fulvivirga sp.]|nr:Rossmann-like and DUF2520 domain-containing protein [Fulvivirga sp.]
MNQIKVHIVGTGNVAWHMAKAIVKSNAQITGISSQNAENAESFAAISKAPVKDIENSIDADVILLCIPDHAIASVALKLNNTDALVCHTSGATSLEALHPIKKQGVIWPIQSLKKDIPTEYEHLAIAIEANSQANLEVVKSLTSFSDQVRILTHDQRLMLHLAAVFTNNFTNHMIAIAQDICKEHHLDFDLLRPLLKETYIKLETTTALDAQTGPAIRKDSNTIEKQKSLLKNHPLYKEIYTVISASIQKHNKEH